MSTTPELLNYYTPKNVADALKDELQTTHALCFHTRRGHLHLATAHEVSPNKAGAPQIGPGRPLGPEDEATVLRLLLGRSQEAGFEVFPPTLLFRDTSGFVAWLPPEIRPMHLRLNTGAVHTIQARWPNLVMLVRERAVYLVAIDGIERPTATSPLFHAPMPNTYADARLCTGSATLPSGHSMAELPAWEAVIFDTAWTHTNSNLTLRPATGKGKRKVADERADATFWATRNACLSPFPTTRLNPMNCTLEEWVRGSEKGARLQYTDEAF